MGHLQPGGFFCGIREGIQVLLARLREFCQLRNSSVRLLCTTPALHRGHWTCAVAGRLARVVYGSFWIVLPLPFFVFFSSLCVSLRLSVAVTIRCRYHLSLSELLSSSSLGWDKVLPGPTFQISPDQDALSLKVC